MKENINLEDVDEYLDESELFRLNKKAFISLEDVDFYLDNMMQYHIPQVDGLDDVSYMKNYFSVNCQIDELIALITFFRSFESFWNNSTQHTLCAYQKNAENCFFCLMRSTCARINAPRATGPKSLKIVEFASQLPKYQDVLRWDWKKDKNNMTAFIENTLKLLIRSEKSVFERFVLQQYCKQCERCKVMSENLVMDLHVEFSGKKILSMQEVLSLIIQEFCDSCRASLSVQSQTGYVIIRFSRHVNIEISNNTSFMERKIKYVSHISEEIYVGLRGNYQHIYSCFNL